MGGEEKNILKIENKKERYNKGKRRKTERKKTRKSKIEKSLPSFSIIFCISLQGKRETWRWLPVLIKNPKKNC